MRTAVFLCYHGIGHFNACFRLARILQAADHKVIFSGHGFFQKYVEGQGFDYYSLRTLPFGLGFESWANAADSKGSVYWNTLQDRRSRRLSSEREQELRNMVHNTGTDYLFIDSSQSTDLIVLYPLLKMLGTRTAIFHAMLATTVEPDLPPLNSACMPEKSWIKGTHLIFRLRRLKKFTAQWLKYCGKSDPVLIREQVRKNMIPQKYISKKPALFSPAFDHIHQLIMAPAEVELRSRHRGPFQHYLGFMVDPQRHESGDPSFEECFRDIQRGVAAGRTLIYCSLGTVPVGSQAGIRRFFIRLFKAVSSDNRMLVVAGNAFEALSQLALPPYVFVFREVPQYRVLALSRVFITHGGWNSVKEAVYCGVPLLVYPLDHRTDQPGISSRVVHHQLGLRGDMKKDSPDAIRAKIHELLVNPAYAERISTMNRIDRSYTPENFLEILQRIDALD